MMDRGNEEVRGRARLVLTCGTTRAVGVEVRCDVGGAASEGEGGGEA